MISSIEEARRCLPPVWVIYRHPRDFPANWVVRVWHGMYPEPVACLCTTLTEARESAPPGAVKLAPSFGDDPCIFETWL